MARRITVSAIAPAWWEADPATAPEDLVQEAMRRWDREIRQVLPDRPDIIVLPEVCDRFNGLTPQQNSIYYDARGTRIKDFFAGIARRERCYIAYSAVRQAEDGFFRNSTQLIGREGKVESVYNKNHLVVSEGPLNGPYPMKCGRDAVVAQLDMGRVGCVICFDLNFSELKKKYLDLKPELMLFSSNYHGDFHQQEWAYDCRSYFVSAVRNQEARILSPLGDEIAASTCYQDYITANINLDYVVCYLDFNQDRLRAAKEKYGRGIRVHDAGKTGAILITSEREDNSARDIANEFGIETIDDYFARSRRDQLGRVEDGE